MTFKELNITEPILKAIEEKGYAVPTPIQERQSGCIGQKRYIRLCADGNQVRLLRLLFLLYNIYKTNKEAAKVPGNQGVDIERLPANLPCK